MSLEQPEPYVFVGPRPFEHSEGRAFFGRRREASELCDLLIASPVVLLYAASGAGKTSLLNAAVVPALREEGVELLPVARLGGKLPHNAPAEVSNVHVFQTLLSWSEGDGRGPRGVGADSGRLARMTLADFLRQREPSLDEDGQETYRVAIFDQFEEFFTSLTPRWEDQRDFFRQLSEALDENPALRVLFSMREDFLAEWTPYQPLLARKLRMYRLERMGKEAALEAVSGPLKLAGRAIRPEAAQQLVRSLMVRGRPETGEEVLGRYVEPLQLQLVCQDLWRRLRPEVREIGLAEVSEAGDVRNVLSDFYDDSVREAAAEADVSEGDIRRWFESVLITPAGTRGMVFRGPAATGGVSNAAVESLERRQLIRAELREGELWYELTHDRFIEAIRYSNERWPAASGEPRPGGGQSEREDAEKPRRLTPLLISLLIVAVILALAGWLR